MNAGRTGKTEIPREHVP